MTLAELSLWTIIVLLIPFIELFNWIGVSKEYAKLMVQRLDTAVALLEEKGKPNEDVSSSHLLTFPP
jgi:hypothetical protein